MEGCLHFAMSTLSMSTHIGIFAQAHETMQSCTHRYIHIGESHRGYLGTGSVDFPALFRALAAAGYQGPLTFESFSSAVVSPSLSNTLCVWRNLCVRLRGQSKPPCFRCNTSVGSISTISQAHAGLSTFDQTLHGVHVWCEPAELSCAIHSAPMMPCCM